MHIRCPHCQIPIEFVDADPLVEIQCPSCGSSFSLLTSDTTETFRSGTRRLAHFEMVRELGIGKFGSVWLAHDTELDRRVAVKIPRKGALDTEETKLFLRDARAAAQLKHPRIVGVHEVGREGDTVYIVSDYVEGINLKERLSGGRLSFRESAELVAKVAEALEHAHQSGVVHRDLKPGNIMLDDKGGPHVIDFGLAKREAGEITMTVDGHVLGTPAYMSPEQAAGKGHDADARSDVYSLGVILYELLTGELPYRGEKQMIIWQIQHDEPSRPRRLNSRIPRDLETICLKAMTKEPARRYQSAAKIADDLNRYLAGEPILARPVGSTVRVLRWARRNPWVAGLSAAIALLLATVTIGSIAAATRIARARDEAKRSALQERSARAEAEKAQLAAEANLAEAQRQRTQAVRSFQQARQAVDEYFTIVSASRALAAPTLEPLRRQLLESALRYHERFVAEHADDPAVRMDLVASHLRVAAINQNMGSSPYPAKRRALDLLRRMVEENVPLEQLGTLLEQQDYAGRNNPLFRNPVEVTLVARESAELFGILVRRYPHVGVFRRQMSVANTVLGCWERQRRNFDEALYFHARAEEAALHLAAVDSPSPEDLYLLANTILQKARTLERHGKLHDAERAYRLTTAAFESVPRTYLRWQDTTYNLACARRDLAYLLWSLPANRPEAEFNLRAALGTFVDLASKSPEIPGFCFDAATNHDALAQMLEDTGRDDDAKTEYLAALDGFEKLVLEFPDQDVFQKRLELVVRGLLALFGRQGDMESQQALVGRGKSIDDRRNRRSPARIPHGPQEPNDIAWFQAVCGDSQFVGLTRAAIVSKTTSSNQHTKSSH